MSRLILMMLVISVGVINLINQVMSVSNLWYFFYTGRFIGLKDICAVIRWQPGAYFMLKLILMLSVISSSGINLIIEICGIYSMLVGSCDWKVFFMWSAKITSFVIDPPGSPGRLTVRFLTTIPSAAENSMQLEDEPSILASPSKEIPGPLYAILHAQPITPTRRQSIVTLHPTESHSTSSQSEPGPSKSGQVDTVR